MRKISAIEYVESPKSPKIPTRGADKGIEVGKKPDLTYSRHTLSKIAFRLRKAVRPSVRPVAKRKNTERDDGRCSIARRGFGNDAGDRIPVTGEFYFRGTGN